MSAQVPCNRLTHPFEERFGRKPVTVAYAPGRVEILGNHTDYNDGLVLSAAIDRGNCFALDSNGETICWLVAKDLDEEVSFEADRIVRRDNAPWANYVLGVAAGLSASAPFPSGFDAMFTGNIPLGAGLSSSAALEMSAGLALCRHYGIEIAPLDLARIGQAAEHDFAGTRCGLLDQISSLFARSNHLVLSDFRSLEIENVPLGDDVCFLMCNTHAAHALVDGAYNERRAQCEEAARFFDGVLSRPVRALRDVSQEDWEQFKSAMDPVTAKRAAHIVGENERVLKARERLTAGDLAGFGQLMFESHESSRTLFENSCRELDVVVEAARRTPGVLGARLSGGGFGGSAVVLLHPRDSESVRPALAAAYQKECGRPCDIRVIRPSDGARVVESE